MPREQSLECVAISSWFFIRTILDGLEEWIAHRGGQSDRCLILARGDGGLPTIAMNSLPRAERSSICRARLYLKWP